MQEPRLKGKTWGKEFEKEVYEKWKKEKTYKFNKNLKKPVYSIDTPPPYVNTPVHIGQATTYVLMDMFARFKRMTNHNVLFPLGLDRNGLPIEVAAERKFNVKLTETSREKFLGLCKKVLEESSEISTNTFLRLGISFNSLEKGKAVGDLYMTDSKEYRTLTQATFIDMWKKGLIYPDDRINNWCPGCQTTLADAEIEYKEINTNFNDTVFKVKETGEEIIIGTTRPELICSCGMVIFHPDDKRYKHLNGKTVLTPLYNKEIKLQAHPMADPEKGTGLVMMCSAGDTSDIRFFREMNLDPIISINKDGTMNKNAGFLEGLKVKEARKKIIDELRTKGLLVNQKQTTHRTPVCERSKDEIEFISMEEFYVKQIEYKKKILQLASKAKFFAEDSRKIFIDWTDSVSIDWPITRRRYYATEVPLWYCKKCTNPFLPEKGKYYKPWKEKCPLKKCKKCGSKDFVGDERVFDTWFDSSITPLYILGYGYDDKFFKKHSPCSLRPQGKEIIRTWLYYTILKSYLLTGKLIFDDVWINFHIVDESGKKMSKSLNNIIDPQEVLNEFGAEPFRLWCVIEGNLEKIDFRCSFERIGGAGKTLNKLWNVSRFISMFPEPKGKTKLTATDKWILNEINSIVKLSKKNYEKYDFHTPTTTIKHFIWETFASHYLELVKNRAYNQEGKFEKELQKGALFTLNKCLSTLLRLLSPVTPMFTYKVYSSLYKKDIHSLEFPKEEKRFSLDFKTDEILNLNSQIWKAKKDKGLSLKAEIKKITLSEKFKSIIKDLCVMHNIKEFEFGKKLDIVF